MDMKGPSDRYLPSMAYDIKNIVANRLGENYELHEQYVNPTLVDVFRTIGFDRVYSRGEGAHLWDRDGVKYLDMLGGFGGGRNQWEARYHRDKESSHLRGSIGVRLWPR
jgi:hypothetical protein